MSASSTVMHLITRAAIGLGALCLVGVLLAAIPNHKTPLVASIADQGAPQQNGSSPAIDHGNMPEMDMDDVKTNEAAAVHDMAHMNHGASAHTHMTAIRTASAGDQARANEIVEALRAGIEKYKDYRVALNDGYKIFLPNVPQAEYHFTNYANGFLEALRFDASKPTSLLYKKTSTGYELVGAMYTMPKRATEDQLNERVPLGVAAWHLHTNLCMPSNDERRTADYTKFGLRGSIATQEACDAAGGTFHPVIFGWMVHVYPYEQSTEKIFAMHHD